MIAKNNVSNHKPFKQGKTTMRCDILVIGAGPAGLAAALEATLNGAGVILAEGEEIAGKKLLLTGGGRCNFTRRGTVNDLVDGFHENGRFLYSPLSHFDNRHYCDFLKEAGVAITCDDTGRCLTRAGRAVLVRDAFLQAFRRAGGNILYREKIQSIAVKSEKVELSSRIDVNEGSSPAKFLRPAEGENFDFIATGSSHVFLAKSVILAAGAPCYPKTGSTGNLLPEAAKLGLSIKAPTAALCPIALKEDDIAQLAGISLADAQLTVKRGRKKLAEERGSLLFSHSGLTGPLALNISRWLSGADLTLTLNLIPGENPHSLLEDLQQVTKLDSRLTTKNVLRQYVPKALALYLLRKLKLDPSCPLRQVSQKNLRTLAHCLTLNELTYKSLPSYEKGMTCRGGLSLKDFDSRTMMARSLPGFFAAGDILDLDGKSGGYNLQAAYSTGRLAGLKAADFCQHSL